MAVFGQGDIIIDGVKIHYYRSGGKKPPFLLLHGATDNGLCWTPIAKVLAEKYDVIMPDAQGHGLSDRLGPGFSFENHTNQTAGLIRELGLKKPVIMGHSMGAGTTVNLAIEYPSIPKAIILEDPAWRVQVPQTAQSTEEAKKQMEAFRDYLTGVGQLPLEEIIEQSRKNDPSWAEEERLPWATAKKQSDATLFNTMVINPRSYEELVPRIQCPTLLIIAEKGIVAKETAEKAAQLWRSKETFKWVYIKGAGHNIRREQFEAFKKAIFEFLKMVEG